MSVRVLSNPVEDGVHSLPIGDLIDALDGVLLGVQDNVVSPIRLCKLRLLRRRCGTDNSGTTRLGVSRKEEAEAASDGMHEYDITFLDIVGLVHEGDDRQRCSRASD